MKEAGRELDAVVAAKVMGLQVYQATEDDMIFTLEREFVQAGDYCYDVEHHMTRLVPAYSTSIEAAWQVVERMIEQKYTYYVGGFGTEHEADFWMWNDDVGKCVAIAPTAPHAICLAALAAVGADV